LSQLLAEMNNKGNSGSKLAEDPDTPKAENPPPADSVMDGQGNGLSQLLDEMNNKGNSGSKLAKDPDNPEAENPPPADAVMDASYGSRLENLMHRLNKSDNNAFRSLDEMNNDGNSGSSLANLLHRMNNEGNSGVTEEENNVAKSRKRKSTGKGFWRPRNKWSRTLELEQK